MKNIGANTYKPSISRSKFRYNGQDIKYYLTNSNQINFELTDNCNLKCEYCINGEFYTNRSKLNNTNLNFDTAKKMLDYLVDFWNTSFNSSQNRKTFVGFYGGEPLLRFNLIAEIVNYVKTLSTKHNSFSFAMTTNGLLLNKYMPFLVENDFNLLISLDGGTEINNSYRKYPNQQSAFKQIYNNIITLKNKYPIYFENKVAFNSVLHNKNSIPEVLNFFQTEFNKTPQVTNIDSHSVNPELKESFAKMAKPVNSNLQENEEYTLLEKKHKVGVYADFLSFLYTYSGYIKKDYSDLIMNKENGSKIPTGTCEPFSRRIFVTASGKILPCERVGHQFALGFVNESEVELDFNKIAEKYNAYFDNISSECQQCFMKSTCSRCMFQENVDLPDVKCSMQKDNLSFSKLFSKQLSYVEKSPGVYSEIMNNINLI